MSVDLSVVVAVYNEDPRNLIALLERLWQIITPLGLSYELVFVDDGSKPATAAALRKIAEDVDYAKLVVLSRNFGQQAAISAGLEHADGQAVINIDSDLQDPPELIPEMVKLWQQGYEVVYAQRSTRKDRFGKRLSAYLFYRLLGALSSVEIPWDTGDYRLLDRKVVSALLALPEKTRFLRGLIPWLGFKQIGVSVDRHARVVGESSYTLRGLVKLAIDGLLSFSVAPLYVLPVLGSVAFAIGLAGLGIWALAGGRVPAPDAGALVFVLVLLSGLQILSTGLVAVYLAKVLDEVRARPTYVVTERIGFPFAQESLTTSVRGQEDAPVKSQVYVN